MALDERRISTRNKLKESYLQAERQKAVMFATLNRVRQSLQDQGAQPQLRQGSEASSSTPDIPFLWMPRGSAGNTQQGLHGAECLRTGSGSVGLKSVHKVHGLASPQHKRSLNPTVTFNKTKARTQSSSDHGVSASMLVRHPDSQHQREDAAATARSISWDSQTQTPQPLHHNASIPHPTVPSMDSEATEQSQAAATGRQQPHPVAQHPHSHPHSQQHQAEGQHSQQPATAVSPPKPVQAHMPSPRQVEKHLAGVRPAAGGWEARIGRQGYSKAKESLGVHATAFAAARAYDRALLTNRRPSEQPNNFNFPVQDYVAAEDSDLSKAAMVQMYTFHAKPSSKRSRPSSTQAPHQSPPSKRRPTDASPAQPRCAVNLPVGHSNAVPILPVKQSWKRQTLTDQHLHQRPEPAAAKPGEGVGWHQMHLRPPQSEDHAREQLHKQAQTGIGSWQAETGRTAPVGDAGMAQRSGVDSDEHVHEKVPSTSGNHRSESSVLSGASLATSTQRTYCGCPPEDKPAAYLDACTACAFETGAAGSAAPDDAARHHNEPQRAAMSYKELRDTGRRQEHPRLHPVVCHAPRQARAAPPHDVPGSLRFPDAPARPSPPQADGAAARHHADAALPGKPAQTIPAPTPHSDGCNPPSGSNAGQAAAKPSSSMLSPEPETVRAGDSDDDVEIMDDSPVHKTVSSTSLSRQDTPPKTDDCTQQQARENLPHRESAEGDLPPWNQEQQLPEQLPGQHFTQQQDLQTQQQHGAQHQGSQQQQQQQQPGERPQEPQQQQQQCFQHFLQQQFFQQDEQSSQQHKRQQQPHQQDGQAGLSFNPSDLSGLPDLAQQDFTTAGGEWLPPSAAAAGTPVKQEPAAPQSRDTAHMPCGGHPSQEAVAGSSLTHPVELSESDADSSASSSVDPSQRVPAPWLHADTAASRQQEASGHGDSASAQGAVPAGSAKAETLNRVLLRQASQGSTLTNGRLRTKRGPIDKAEQPRSKLARLATPAVPSQPAAHESRRGATAAEAVDLSDDDDDVVIIEEGMQPEPHLPQPPKGLKAPAAAKQQGGPPASRSGWQFKPRVPAAAAAARAALFSPSPSAKPPPTSSLALPIFTSHAQNLAGPNPQATQAGVGGLQAGSVLSATLAALRQASARPAHPVSASAQAGEESAAAAAGVAELRRTEQQSNPEFKAAQEAEWQQRQAEIGKQAEHAQRLKRQRKAEKEKKARQEAEVARRLAEHRAERGRKEAEEQEKDQIRVRIRERLAGKLDKAKTMRQVLTVFGIPVEGGFAATSAQVDKAYKKAMIMFHPDKHVNKGLENQLEAEESFKIISHIKNKKSK